MAQPILTVADLAVTFDHETILKNITFSVNQHEVLAILGPNGAGKSTLLRALLGLVPHNGSVHWGSKNIGYLPPQESIQRKNLPPLTVYDFFALKNISAHEAQAAVHDVGLAAAVLEKPFATLSTGQFQRMMLAWVLADKPDILLLDEPVASVDVSGEETVFALLHRIWKDRNLTIILITHNISIIWKHATRILCLNKTLICHGTPEETLTADILKKVYGTEVTLYEHRHPTAK